MLVDDASVVVAPHSHPQPTTHPNVIGGPGGQPLLDNDDDDDDDEER